MLSSHKSGVHMCVSSIFSFKSIRDVNNLVCIADIRTRYSYIRVPVKR
jgi:hypothetical protein